MTNYLCFLTKIYSNLKVFHKTAPGLSHISSSYTLAADVILSVIFKLRLWPLLTLFWMRLPPVCSLAAAESTRGSSDSSERTRWVSKPWSWPFCGKYGSTPTHLLVSKPSWLPTPVILSPPLREACWDTARTPLRSPAAVAPIPSPGWGLLSRPK